MDRTPLPEDFRPEGELTPGEAERILARTLMKAGLPPREEKKPMKKNRFGLLLLAGVLCTGVVAASAAAIFQWDKRMAEHLDASESQQELLDGAGMALGQTSERDGWTMTMRQALGDKNQVYVLLDLAAPEGTKLDGDQYYFNMYNIRFDPLGPGGYTMDLLEDEDPSDNKITFMVELEASNGLRGSTVNMSFGELVELRQGESNVLAKGEWDFSVKMDYKDTGRTTRPNTEVEALGGTLKVEEITVSPLSLTVTLRGSAVAEFDKQPPDPEVPLFDLVPVALFDKSGQEVDAGGASVSIGDDVFTYRISFGKVLDPADFGSITVAGVEIPLK